MDFQLTLRSPFHPKAESQAWQFGCLDIEITTSLIGARHTEVANALRNWT